MSLDLALVMPVYNEAACIVQVIGSWREMLASLGLRFRLLVLDDGSCDGTKTALAAFAGDGRLEILHKENTGHGPTILLGYRRAVQEAKWIFQCDSDGEIGAEHFPALWEKREGYDALFGVRKGRRQSPTRQLISVGSRLVVRLWCGRGAVDVNVPYRLMRADILAQIVEQIPADTFAPNVIISGALARAGARLYHHPVPLEGRRTGRTSLAGGRLWRAAWRAFWQTLRCRPRLELTGGAAAEHGEARARK